MFLLIFELIKHEDILISTFSGYEVVKYFDLLWLEESYDSYMLMIKLTSFVPSGVYVVKLGKRVLLRSMLCKRSTYLKFRHQNIWFLNQLIDIQFIIKKRLFVNLFPHHVR